MGAAKRVRWECAEGLHPGVLGSTRPRSNSIVRYCLPCSENAGVLIERVAPALERQRNAKTAMREQRRRTERERAVEAKARALIVPVIDENGVGFDLDAGVLLREAWRTSELRSQQRDAWPKSKFPPPLPELVIRRGKAGRGRDSEERRAWIVSPDSRSNPIRLRDTMSGHAAYDGSRIVLTARPDLGAEWLRAIVVHEAAHAACPVDAQHGPRWRTAYVRAIREIYPGLPLAPLPDLPAPNWRLDEEIAEALLRWCGLARS